MKNKQVEIPVSAGCSPCQDAPAPIKLIEESIMEHVTAQNHAITRIANSEGGYPIGTKADTKGGVK